MCSKHPRSFPLVLEVPIKSIKIVDGAPLSITNEVEGMLKSQCAGSLNSGLKLLKQLLKNTELLIESSSFNSELVKFITGFWEVNSLESVSITTSLELEP